MPSYPHAPKAITHDIDDTADIVHGHQQMSLFNAHQDERCFARVDIYDADTGHCVTTVLRPGKTPNGKEVRGHVRRMVRSIRRHWPKTRILFRGDSHHGRKEGMEWCENNDLNYIFGFGPNKVLVRVEATKNGADVRYIVTNLKGRSAKHLYEKVYCARGQPENLIKRHKSQLASDRTSCRSPIRCA